MNAYELADKVDFEPYGIYGEQAANMLRQQADRIAELEKVSKPVAWMDYLEHSNVYDLNVSGRGIPLYTTPQIKELSDEEILFTESEVNVLKNAIGNYVCTLKAELTEEQNKFKGYERCSDIKAIVSELKDAERALEILKKASEK